MNNLKNLLLAAAITVPVLTQAQNYAPGIIIDGNFSEWDGQIPATVTDPSGDDVTGSRDIIAIYAAHDDTNLYIRLQSSNSIAYDGAEITAIDGDNAESSPGTPTGFNFFGIPGLGTDTHITGASMSGASSGSFGGLTATPNSVPFGPFVATTDVEFSVPLNTTLTGADIAQSFPGGIGSAISLIYLDTGGGGTQDSTAPTSYTLVAAPSSTPTMLIDNMDLYDTDANALFRTNETSSSVSQVAVAGNFAAGGSGGVSDTALQGTFTLDDSDAFGVAQLAHRFAAPVDITGHADVILDYAGDAASTGASIWVGLVDLEGDYFAVTVGAPTTTSFAPVSLGDTGSWFAQAPQTPAVGRTADGVLDLDEIIEWRIGLQPGTAVSGTYTVGFGNLGTSIIPSSVIEWEMMD